jgi:hypothetical protein
MTEPARQTSPNKCQECCSSKNRQSKQPKPGAAGRCPDVSLSLVTFSGGRIRTEKEHSSLLRQAGFRLRNNVATQSEVSVLEAFAA